MHDYLTEWLVCPDCQGDLSWQIEERAGSHIESGQARCQRCGVGYPLQEGIGIFLPADLPREDLWQEADSALVRYLQDNPDVAGQLMDVPLDSLAPADQFFRAMVLEEQGDFEAAARAEALAHDRLYTLDYRACADSQLDAVADLVSQGTGPIVDLASGRGYLVRRLVELEARPVVATDFSLTVLRRNRRWLKHIDRYERVSLLAVDARRTPFRDRVVPSLTTYLGLPNIERPGDLLVELRRIVGGSFMAVSHFYPPEDELNGQAIRQAGLALSLYKSRILDGMAESGWRVEVVNACLGTARPTPTGVVLEGAVIDGLPVAETTLEWCILVGR